MTLGKYYTPGSVAQALTDWAVTSARSLVLDPSFGGCSFLYSALQSLRNLGNPAPGRQVYGIDLDPDALSHVGPLMESGAVPSQFVIGDFFAVSPATFGSRFDAVVGNPPYVRHHEVPDELLARASARLLEHGVAISGQSSYWAYFLLYAVQFLRPGGRLAMVLPGAFLHTDYAASAREYVAANFEDTLVILLDERVFPKTSEESVLLLASGAAAGGGSVRVRRVVSPCDLRGAMSGSATVMETVSEADQDGGWLRVLTPSRVLASYEMLLRQPRVIRAGQWLRSSIGIVTGSNSYFILSRSQQGRVGIPVECLSPIVRRASWLRGLSASDQGLARVLGPSDQYLLLRCPPSPLPGSAVGEYLAVGESHGVHLHTKCRQRRPWYVIPDGAIPPAFYPVMSGDQPRIVVNDSSYTCTNNILRLWWRKPEEREPLDWQRVALGTLSTLSQLSAELVGRSYGGGVLKLEPSEFAQLAIPLLTDGRVEALVPEVDRLLREGLRDEATQHVDEALIAELPGLDRSDLSELRAARDELRRRRRGVRPSGAR